MPDTLKLKAQEDLEKKRKLELARKAKEAKAQQEAARRTAQQKAQELKRAAEQAAAQKRAAEAKARQELEEKRKDALAVHKSLGAAKKPLPKREIVWVDPPRHDPNEKPYEPLPNYTGGKVEIEPLPLDRNEPIRIQKMIYLYDTKPKLDQNINTKKAPADATQTPPYRETSQQQTAQAAKMPALFDAVSPLSKGLAKIMSLSRENPEEAGRLHQFVQESESDPDSPYWRPYAKPTNKAAMQELDKLGIDTSNMDRDWFERNGWLKQYVRIGSSGLPVHPSIGSSKEEKAAYYYARLWDAQGTTDQAESELQGLKKEIGYWANRKDRNYSDGEVLSRIDWNNYPTLSMLRRDQQSGLPSLLNKAIDFDDGAEFGMLWAARNKKTSGSNTIDAAKYTLGEGIPFQPNDNVRSLRDPKSPDYNPYALGSTVDEAAQYFGVEAFDENWLKKNRRIMETGNETAMRMYETVQRAERFTSQAEAELKDFQQAILRRLDMAAVSGKVDAGALLQNALENYPALRRMDEYRLAGNPVQMTRAMSYRFEDMAKVVEHKADILNKRVGSTKSSEDLEAAVQNEQSAILANKGSLLQTEIAPMSFTARKSLLFDVGPDIAWNMKAWFRPNLKDMLENMKLPSGGSGGGPAATVLGAQTTNQPIKGHPYAGHMKEWEEIKLKASEAGKVDSYGMPTESFYKDIGGKPGWMILADEDDRQRTLKENPAIYPLTSKSRTPDFGKGNIDLNNRPLVRAPEGGYTTVRPISFLDEKSGKIVLVPTVVNGKIVSDQQAKDFYYQSGQNLGKFDTDTEADAYAAKLTADQKELYKGSIQMFFVNPLDELTKKRDFTKKVLEEDVSDLQPRSEREMLEIAQKAGFPTIEAYFASPLSYIMITDDIAKDFEARNQKFTLNELEYIINFQNLTNVRNAKLFGYEPIFAETVRGEFQSGLLYPGYRSSIFAGGNSDSSGYDPEHMTQEKFAEQLIQAEVDKYQKEYDHLKSLEDILKDNTQWQYEMEVAARNLTTAIRQLHYFDADFRDKAAKGAQDAMNPVAHPENVMASKQHEFIQYAGNYMAYNRGIYGNDGSAGASIGLMITHDMETAKSIESLSYAMYPYEKDLFNSYWAVDQERALNYFEEIRPSVEHRDRLYHQEQNTGPQELGKIMEDALGKPIEGFETWLTTIEAVAKGEKITADDPRYRGLQDIEQRRGEFVKAIGDKNPMIKILLEAGLSMTDMGVAFLYGGGIPGMNFIMAQEAGASTILDTLEHGGDVRTAIARGTVSSITEFAIEQFGVGDKFVSMLGNPRSFWGKLLKSMASEGFEELPGWIMDNLTDQALGALSETSTLYRELYDQYKGKYGEQEAAKMATEEAMNIKLGQLFDQVLSASIAGGTFGNIVNVSKSINVNAKAKEIMSVNPDIDPATAKGIAQMYSWEELQDFEFMQPRETLRPGILVPPTQTEVERIAQAEAEGNFAGAAELSYVTTMFSLQGNVLKSIDMLTADEGGVAMVSGMVINAVKAKSGGTDLHPLTRGRYAQLAQTTLGLDGDAIGKFSSFVNNAMGAQDDAGGTDLITALSAISSMDDAKLSQLVDAYSQSGELDLYDAQALDRLLKLRDAVRNDGSHAEGIVGDTLLKATSDAMKDTLIHTGDPKLDAALEAAASTSHNMDIVKERWGPKGVNYFSNLIKANRGKEAALLIALPPNSKAVIVAEELMNTPALSMEGMNTQLDALKQDLSSPFMKKQVSIQADRQALAALKADLVDQGAMADLTTFENKLEEAERILQQAKASKEQALQTEQKAKQASEKAQIAFSLNQADPNAAQAVQDALSNQLTASLARIEEDKAIANSQVLLANAKKNLNDAKVQANSQLENQAKQLLEKKRKRRMDLPPAI